MSGRPARREAGKKRCRGGESWENWSNGEE
jgi:hypothetical protein